MAMSMWILDLGFGSCKMTISVELWANDRVIKSLTLFMRPLVILQGCKQIYIQGNKRHPKSVSMCSNNNHHNMRI